MKCLLWLFAVFLVAAQARDVRDNGGNCVGVKSCRPRCVTFRVDRHTQDCGFSTGIFQVQSDLNPWDISRFKAVNCKASNTCINDLCNQDLAGDLTVRIGEEGRSGSLYFTTIFLPEDDDQFTYCSIYPCPKDECAVPEQMGFGLRFDFLPGSVAFDEPADTLLHLEMYLTAAFVGPPIKYNVQNRFGPLHIEWMDDPTGCRKGDFSPFAPVPPISDPTVLTNTSTLAQSLYCTGEEYNPAPLPQTSPSTPAPSAFPTNRLAPSAFPTNRPAPTVAPTLSSIHLSQIDPLKILYNSTAMSSSGSASRHNWFDDLEYCSYTGVTCDIRGFVRGLDLTALRLAGSLPTEIGDLQRLQVLKLVNNKIGGTLPTQLGQLTELTHIEMGSNKFVGTIPTELAILVHLRRMMLQNNRLNGTIPEELCDLNRMTSFDISSNVDMHGEIPPCFGNLALEFLMVDDVGLVGEVPSALCDVRPFNGLYPNVYGCRAIACPAGEFEPNNGREDGNQAECQRCPIPSNVIGSTTCMVVDQKPLETTAPTATLMPTTPTPQPSSAPFSVVVEEPSQEPSSAPLSLPTVEILTDSPTSAPSKIETPVPTRRVQVTVLFRNVSSAMTEVDDIKTFERITKEFVAESVPNVKTVEILSQSLRLPNKGEPTLTLHSRRFLETSESLFVQMQIDGDVSADNFVASVVAALEDTEGYQDALSQELHMFKTPEDVEPEPQLQTKNRQVNWKLLGSAVVLSVLAMGTVVMVRRRHKKHDKFIDNNTRYMPETPLPIPQRGGHVLDPYDISLSEESSGGWVSEESEDDSINQETSMAGYSSSIDGYSSHTELYLMSQASETLV